MSLTPSDLDPTSSMPGPFPSSPMAAAAATATIYPPLTLIVAATPVSSPSNAALRRLGIGNAGTLPWPRIKADMTFFARVTTRPPPAASQGCAAVNAVLMGRKTYDSLPSRFRPLPKRLNVVVTREETGILRNRLITEWQAARLREQENNKTRPDGQNTGTTIPTPAKPDAKSGVAASRIKENNNVSPVSTKEEPDILVSNSLEAALHELYHDFPSRFSNDGTRQLGKIFIIGGATIYASALRLDPETVGRKMRIIMTDIRRRDIQVEKGPGTTTEEWIKQITQRKGNEAGVDAFECDTFFPIDDLVRDKEWREASPTEVTEWVGEDVSGDWKGEGDVMLRVMGFERV